MKTQTGQWFSLFFGQANWTMVGKVLIQQIKQSYCHGKIIAQTAVCTWYKLKNGQNNDIMTCFLPDPKTTVTY